jgi:hypothetical protein
MSWPEYEYSFLMQSCFHGLFGLVQCALRLWASKSKSASLSVM